jgi:WD40 repeat protein
MDQSLKQPLVLKAEIQSLLETNSAGSTIKQYILESDCEEMLRKPDFELEELSKMLKAIENADPFSSNAMQTTLQVHSDSIRALSFSPDEKFLATGSDDHSISLWNLSSSHLEISLPSHSASVLSLSFSPDGSLLASGSRDTSINVYSLSSYLLLFSLEKHRLDVTCVRFSPDGKLLASSSKDNSVKLWSVAARSEEFSLRGNASSVGFSPDGRLLATGALDWSVKVWNVAERREEFVLEGHSGQPTALCFSPDGRFLASGSRDKTIKVWNLAERREEVGIEAHKSTVNAIAFSIDGRFLASGGAENCVKVWNVRQGREEFNIDAQKGNVFAVEFSKDGRWLATGGEDPTAKLWSIAEKRAEKTIEARTGNVNAVCFSPNGKFVASGLGDYSVKVWSVGEWNEESCLKGHTGCVSSVCFSPDARFIASGSWDCTVKVWDVAKKCEEFSLEGHKFQVSAVIFSPNGKFLASGSWDCTVKVWNIVEKREEFSFEGPTGYVFSVSFSPDGSFLASGSEDKTVRLWNLADKTEEFEFKGHTGNVFSVCFSPDGKLLASGSDFHTVKVWNVADRREEFSISTNTGYVPSVSFSPDGTYLAIGSDNKTVKLWNVAEKREEYLLEGHTNVVQSVSFSPDGKYLASGSWDSTVKLWNLSAKREDFLLEKVEEEATASISPDGKLIVTISTDMILSVWSTDSLTTLFTIPNCSSKIFSISFLPGGILKITNRLSLDFRLFDSKGNEIHTGRSSFAPAYHKTDLASITYPKLHSIIPFVNAISSIKSNQFSRISDWNLTLSNNNYTALHIAAFNCKIIEIEAALKEFGNIQLKADKFGRSPLFYSIQGQHQLITDILLQYLIELVQDDSKPFEIRYGSFYAVRNDLPLIIKSSSQHLCDFLSVSLFFPSKKPPVFGTAAENTKFVSSFIINDSDFITETLQEAEPLRVKASYFEVPSSYGTVLSIELIDAFLKCTQKNVYKVQLVNAYLTYKWNHLMKLTYLYTASLWINLALLTLYFSSVFESSIYSIIGLVIINLLLLSWEIAQIIATGKQYFLDSWNIVDILSITATFTWIALDFSGINELWLHWVVALLSIVRGITGFRAFTMTRFYIGLILVSVKKITSFVIIFIYTTLSFGLLRLVALSEPVGFHSLWLDSFVLVTGKIDYFESANFDLLTVTFMIAVFLNVILMLNMIISILGDSFDEFQVLQVYYDKKEMCEVILEIEQIFSLFGPKEEKRFIHTCTGFYNENEEGMWQGRVVEVSDVVEKNAELTRQNIKAVDENIKKVEKNINEKLSVMEESIKAVEGNLNKKLALVEGNIKEVNDNMAVMGSKLDELLKILVK